MATIWSEILDVAISDAGADFFERGGDSLSAVQVLSRVHEAFGVEISIADFFERPVLRDLAAHIEVASGASDARAAMCEVSATFGPPSLYFIGTGTDESAAGLGLPAGHPYVILDVRGAETFEAKVSRSVELLQRLRPSSSCVIGGRSEGGRVAIETACRLEARGEPIAGVILVDTPPASAPGTDPLARVRAPVVLIRTTGLTNPTGDGEPLEFGWLDRLATRLTLLEVADEPLSTDHLELVLRALGSHDDDQTSSTRLPRRTEVRSRLAGEAAS